LNALFNIGTRKYDFPWSLGGSASWFVLGLVIKYHNEWVTSVHVAVL